MIGRYSGDFLVFNSSLLKAKKLSKYYGRVLDAFAATSARTTRPVRWPAAMATSAHAPYKRLDLPSSLHSRLGDLLFTSYFSIVMNSPNDLVL